MPTPSWQPRSIPGRCLSTFRSQKPAPTWASSGLDRVQLVRTFQQPAGYPSAQARFLAVEALGFTPVEADIITAGTLAAGHQSWDYWGLAQNGNTIVDPYDPTSTVSGTWIEVLTQTRVLLTRANLTYQELARLLNTRFINDNDTVSIVCNPPDSCDVATMTMAGSHAGCAGSYSSLHAPLAAAGLECL